MSPIKAFGTVAIMIACFVVIYPRFMHPFVLRAIGLYEPPKKNADDNMYPPHFKAMHPGASKHPAAADEAKKHIRQTPPHPGMRAAAEMQRQQAQQGSGRGMMGVVLPMYAIGIVLYLIYTLFKVFNKPNKGDSWDNEGSSYGSRMNRDYPLDRMGLQDDCEGEGDVHNIYTDDGQRKQLEHLLTRIDDKNVSLDEMRMLQKRLEETEAQMCRILRAMQSVHSNIDKQNLPENVETTKGQSDGLNSDLHKSREEEDTGKQCKNVTGDKEHGRKPNLESKHEEELSTAAVQDKITHGSQPPQRNIVSPDDSSDDTEVQCQGEDGGVGLTSTEEMVDIGDQLNTTETTQTNVRHRKGKHENEQ